MKLMMATMIRGSRSSRRASTRSWNGVVKARRSAAWTLIQLLRRIVVNMRTPSSLRRMVSGPISSTARAGSPRVTTSGKAARANGIAMNAPRAVRSGPRWADQDTTTRSSHATSNARYEPTGSRATARMKAIARMNFRRASNACSQLGRAM